VSDDFEPVKGLPESLPAGEDLLWQGAPRWGALTRRAFFIWPVVIYFAVIISWLLITGVKQGEPWQEIYSAVTWQLMLAGLTLGILSLIGWLFARTTVYSITSRRIVLRFGMAIPLTVNLPFAKVASAELKVHKDGTGDIPLQMAPSEKISYFLLWPNIRPWKFKPPQPMLRAVPEAETVAALLAKALEEATDPAQQTDGETTAVPSEEYVSSESSMASAVN